MKTKTAKNLGIIIKLIIHAVLILIVAFKGEIIIAIIMLLFAIQLHFNYLAIEEISDTIKKK